AARNGLKVFANNNIVQNTTIKNCGRIQPPDITYDTKGIGIYINYSNNVIEHNVIDGCRAGGIVVQFNSPTNTVIRYNLIMNGGINSPWPPPPGFTIQSATGINIGPGSSNTLVYNNVFKHMRGDTSSGTGNGADCIFIYDNATTAGVYNNTCYDSDLGIGFG